MPTERTEINRLEAPSGAQRFFGMVNMATTLLRILIAVNLDRLERTPYRILNAPIGFQRVESWLTHPISCALASWRDTIAREGAKAQWHLPGSGIPVAHIHGSPQETSRDGTDPGDCRAGRFVPRYPTAFLPRGGGAFSRRDTIPLRLPNVRNSLRPPNQAGEP